ncbi:hypothetical protein [Xanthomonas translucens]|uniref:hypothetical protein n=1 Tax=Xanthomonas campestris pv. translucens TaxID=343 RepID=UPI00071B6FE2|nr:hypothetical protein [Xanthomonas translucens]MCT8281757.1 hypothetical protein [Xanthomonas translucens pv. undulosa]MCT8316489.1 hypothetical protein [Xanthomonas translucens pv. undulosa]QEN93641.1 hypothetical protein F0H33_09855 [Xanthomonas translucens pv. undulosa]QSQ58044.1 hypothetical protein ISN37_08965 [Xanthomonas translucens pv. undulosa]UKE38274.1 hypothetical protein KCU58_10890 [Xanthomonas translucens pv. undulosa]
MQISNNHNTSLGLPDGTVLAPGESAIIPNWAQLKTNSVVQAWLAAGVLSKEGTEEDGENDEQGKEDLVAKLDAAGVKYDKRWGLEKLQSALAEEQKPKGEG